MKSQHKTLLLCTALATSALPGLIFGGEVTAERIPNISQDSGEESLREKAAHAWDRTGEAADSAWDKTQEATEEGWNKTKEFSADTWHKTKEVSEEAWEKTKGVSEEAWGKTKETTKEATDYIKGKVQPAASAGANVTVEEKPVAR